MEAVYLIVAMFCVGYFVESIFGFAGTVISYVLLALFVDIKTLIFVAMFLSIIASTIIISSDGKNFSKKHFLFMLSMTIPGLIIGNVFLDQFTSDQLMKIFSGLILIMALHSFIDPYIKPALRRVLLFVAGIIHGMFGTGGVVAVATMKNSFDNKAQLRVTFAALFLSLNLIRVVQYSIQGTYDFKTIAPFWWAPIPIVGAIYLGKQVHSNISEVVFKKGISFLLVIAGVFFLLK